MTILLNLLATIVVALIFVGSFQPGSDLDEHHSTTAVFLLPALLWLVLRTWGIA